MAIYKPSNFYPNLKEIDLTEDNNFSCQVNTSGETVWGYEITILNPDNEEIYKYKNTEGQVKNKGTLTVKVPAYTTHLVNSNNSYYKWNIRLYNAEFQTTLLPNTKVCEGYLTGSTKSVIWTQNNTNLQEDRWVEIKTTGISNIMSILEPNDDNITLPGATEEFIERYKITWVTDDLGFEKNITKLEFDDEFKYNYINGTTFNLYNCSSDHGNNNFFTDPNDEINLSNYVVIYSSLADKTLVENQGNLAAANFPYVTGVTIKEQPRKIIGYSSDTGEIRVQENFSAIPKNGYYYVIYEYNSETNIYTLKKSSVSQRIGGAIITSLAIINNVWSDTVRQLFIQPNINIKTDPWNPNEILFNNNDETRIDIVQQISSTLVPGKNVDISIDKLDNSQWLIKSPLTLDSRIPPIIPKSTYTIYTDFIDSSPDNIFYPRKKSEITIQYKKLNSILNVYQDLIDGTQLDVRDIAFKGIWTSLNKVPIKYYKYYLIDSKDIIIGESEDIYSNELYWTFKGLEWDETNNVAGEYTIKLVVVDEFNKIFSKSITFSTEYQTILGLIEAEIDCDSNAIQITAIPPKTIIPIASDNLSVVNNNDINSTKDYLTIPSGEILNYGEMITSPYSDIIFPSTFSFLTQFQITSNFIKAIPNGEELPIFEIAHKNKSGIIDTYVLKMAGFEKFYIISGTENNSIIKVNDDQFHLKIYLNDSTTPLQCFDNGVLDYCDISEYLTGLYTSKNIYYALQEDTGYVFIDSFPIIPDKNIKYVLKQQITYNNVTYYQGVYKYNGAIWNQDITSDYVFVDNLNQISSDVAYTYLKMNVPSNVQGENGDLLINTTNNVWLDTYNNSQELNEIIMDTKWLIFYLTVDNITNDTSTIVRGYVQGNNEGV